MAPQCVAMLCHNLANLVNYLNFDSASYALLVLSCLVLCLYALSHSFTSKTDNVYYLNYLSLAIS